MSHRRAGIGVLLLGVTFFVDSPADAKVARVGDASVSFVATATGGLQIPGTTNELSVADDGTTVKLTVALTNLDTGIGLRNAHTKKYLEVSRFPTAQLSVPRAALKLGESGDVTGDMTIHGQTRKVQVHYDAPKKGNVFAVHGTTHILTTDYGIEVPSYMRITVKPEVTIDVTFSAADS